MLRINRWHKIVIDTPGYGSDLDTVNLDFELCDECLRNFIDDIILKNLIYGDESWVSTEEDYQKNQ